MENIFQD